MAVQARRAKDKLRVVKERPDIVLRDIAMPSGSGLDLLPNIDPEIKIVFTTAFDSYAIRALEMNAFDYLVKPMAKSESSLSHDIAGLNLEADSNAPHDAPVRTIIIDIIGLVADIGGIQRDFYAGVAKQGKTSGKQKFDSAVQIFARRSDGVSFQIHSGYRK